MKQLRIAAGIVVILLSIQAPAKADAVLDWNEFAVNFLIAQSQSPFAQARYMAITQLAVFEAVNAIKGDYQPYLGTVVAPAGASAAVAAGAATYAVLKSYFPAATTLDGPYQTWLATIPDSPSKSGGVATGEAAAAQMVARRVGDGSAPPEFYAPQLPDPAVWQATPSCPAAGGVNFQWQRITPFGVASNPGDQAWQQQFLPAPPPSLSSNRYTKDYNEVKRVGGTTSTERPADRATVARFYAAGSPAFVFNSVARQLAAAQHQSLSENARALALLNMASSDGLVVSFAAKYLYDFWRPETAIRVSTDGNPRTAQDPLFMPYITTPCFPSYPSNHASGSNSASEILRRIYGAGGHELVLTNPALPGVTLRYRTLKKITDDIDDARVFGGIHFRFDQVAGAVLGREVATYVYKHNLGRRRDADEPRVEEPRAEEPRERAQLNER